MTIKILITVDGGMISCIDSTSNNVEITVIDNDVKTGEGESKLVYYRAAPDSLINPKHMKT